ncbi:MAG: hypothetical protein J7K04_12130 [Spirochaetales bacterium]|nr:hypothetical protein [Spirochaetales bacterium]
MTEEQLSFKEDKIVKILNTVYELLKKGNFKEAYFQLESVLKIDFEYPGIPEALKSTKYWIEHLKDYELIEDKFQRGEYLLTTWNAYNDFILQSGPIPDFVFYNTKQFIFSTALKNYKASLDAVNRYDPTILLQLGRSYKAVGNYEYAIQLLENANQINPGNSTILAELADCYSLIDELRASKLFFREAFFINPQEVNLATLESPIIVKLVERLKRKDYNKKELAEWIPVYGNIWNVFNVKRELKPLEIGKLKQSIFTLEQEVKEENKNLAILMPKLLNHYFWLIDHYVSTHEDRDRIEEILEKIKNINETIYVEYTK